MEAGNDSPRRNLGDYLPLAAMATALAIAGGVGEYIRTHESQHHETASPAAVTCLPFPEQPPVQDAQSTETIDQLTLTEQGRTYIASDGEFQALASTHEYVFPDNFARSIGPFLPDFNLQPGLSPQEIDSAYAGALSAVGISVETEKGVDNDYFKNHNYAGPNEMVFSGLSYMPLAVIKASKLSRVVIEPVKFSDYAQVPEHQAGTLFTNQPDLISTGLATMIFDNTCNAGDRQNILDFMESITHQAGKNYDPSYYFNYNALNGSQANDENEDYTERFGSKVFSDTDSVRGPKLEFINLLASAIDGWNWFKPADLKTAIGRKRQLAQYVLDAILPNGDGYEEYQDIIGAYGGCGYYPEEEAVRLRTLIDSINSAPSEQAGNIILKTDENQCLDNVSR